MRIDSYIAEADAFAAKIEHRSDGRWKSALGFAWLAWCEYLHHHVGMLIDVGLDRVRPHAASLSIKLNMIHLARLMN